MLAASAQFGELLRQHQLAARLTQESLAERPGLNEHGIQKLESGATHSYRDTAERLIRGLKLSDQDQALFKIAPRPTPRRLQSHRSTAATPATETRTISSPVRASACVAGCQPAMGLRQDPLGWVGRRLVLDDAGSARAG
jgi:transcriptional regulator with XRE-family HTH domain